MESKKARADYRQNNAAFMTLDTSSSTGILHNRSIMPISLLLEPFQVVSSPNHDVHKHVLFGEHSDLVVCYTCCLGLKVFANQIL